MIQRCCLQRISTQATVIFLMFLAEHKGEAHIINNLAQHKGEGDKIDLPKMWLSTKLKVACLVKYQREGDVLACSTKHNAEGD